MLCDGACRQIPAIAKMCFVGLNIEIAIWQGIFRGKYHGRIKFMTKKDFPNQISVLGIFRFYVAKDAPHLDPWGHIQVMNGCDYFKKKWIYYISSSKNYIIIRILKWYWELLSIIPSSYLLLFLIPLQCPHDQKRFSQSNFRSGYSWQN